MRPLPRHIALINQKGGVGKTTTTANLAAGIARTGRSVLLVDMDPQSHLTMHFGIDPAADGQPTVYNVLTDGTPLAEAIRPTSVQNVRLVPATIDLAAAEVELVGVVGREVLLRDALAGLEGSAGSQGRRAYDYLLLDCPPSLGLLTLNALAAAREVVICLQPHFLGLQGVGKLLETVGLVQQRINQGLAVSGVVLCMYESGTRLAGEVTDDLAGFLAESRGKQRPWSEARIFQTCIRRNIKLAECPSFGQVIFQYAPGSHGAEDYAKLADEVLAMEAATVSPVAPAAPLAPAAGDEGKNLETGSRDSEPSPNPDRSESPTPNSQSSEEPDHHAQQIEPDAQRQGPAPADPTSPAADEPRIAPAV